MKKADSLKKLIIVFIIGILSMNFLNIVLKNPIGYIELTNIIFAIVYVICILFYLVIQSRHNSRNIYKEE
jgi:uncharacterized membrane protein YqhA